MKVLMTGPMYGHNILPFLQFFQGHPEHELHFVYAADRRNTFTPEQFPRIVFHRLDKDPLRALDYLRFLRVLRGGFDLIAIQSGHNYPLFLYFVLFRPRSAMLNAHTWSETVPRQAGRRDLRGAILRYCFRRCDHVLCGWHSTLELIRKAVPEANAVFIPWGIAEESFAAPPERPETDEAARFIGSLPHDRFKFFVPKSVTRFNRHDIIVGAADILFRQGLRDFQIYFWGGNERDDALIRHYREEIERLGLADRVCIVEHSFLPASDILCIWSRMDGGLAIGDRDQLSSTFLEPMLHRKELVASDIVSYRSFNKEYDAQVPLVANRPEALAEAIAEILRGKRTSPDLLEHRRRAIETNLSLERNLAAGLERFEEEIAHRKSA